MTRYCLKGDNPHQSFRFILICPGDRHFDVEGSLILQKGKRVALGIIGGCSMVNMFFLSCSLVSCKYRLSCPDKLLTVWVILKNESDQRTAHFALTSPSHRKNIIWNVRMKFSVQEGELSIL